MWVPGEDSGFYLTLSGLYPIQEILDYFNFFFFFQGSL